MVILSLPTGGTPQECTPQGPPQGYTELSEPSRYWNFDNINGEPTACDRDNLVSGQWYRFTGAAGVMMASHCIPQYSCNSHMAGWINGPHPTVEYQMVTTTACMHWGSDCCYLSYPVEIRNCSGFYVYKLQTASGCSHRYCGVNGEVYFQHAMLV